VPESEFYVTKEEQNIADVQFIFDELQRFRVMPPREVKKYLHEDPRNVFAHLDHPSQGVLFCGRAAFDRFEGLAKRFIKPGSFQAKSFDPPDYVCALRDAFVELFVDTRRAVNQSAVAKLEKRAEELALATLVQLTHHIPCTLFVEKEPSQFTVGPVTFTRVEKFFEDHESALNEYHRSFAENRQTKPGEGSEKELSAEAVTLADRNMQNIRSYYSQSGWVASVSVPSCHATFSKDRAERTVDAALDMLRLLIPSLIQYRRANAPATLSPGWELATDANGKAHASFRLEAKQVSAGEGWHTWAVGEASQFWKPFEKAIELLPTGDKPDELNQRLLDALNWFGQALLEQNAAAKVVKYTAALERLTMTGKVDTGKIEKLIIDRVTMLNQDRTDKKREQIRTEIGELYQWRSDLMHGSRSPYDPAVTDVLQSAWEITRWGILNAARTFALIRENAEPTRQRLAKVYDGGWHRD
jgi:hypothetical protein